MTAPEPPLSTPDPADNRMQMVTCQRCGREYRCTPLDDYYLTPAGDWACTSCLTRGMPLVVVQEQPDGTYEPAPSVAWSHCPHCGGWSGPEHQERCQP